MKPKDWIVHRNTLLNCDDLLDHFSWNLGETKSIENTKATNEKVGNSHDKSSNKGLTARWSKTKKATETTVDASGDTESENEIEHLQLSRSQIANFFRPREERETYKKGNKEEIKDDNEERIDFKVTSRKVSVESSNEYKVPPQDRECKGPSQDHSPRPQDDVDAQTTSTVKLEYPATQRVRKVIEIEYDEERPSTITRTIEVVPDKISINTEEQVAPRQVNLRTTRSSKKGQLIGAKAAASSTSRKVKTRSKIPVRSKLRFVSDKDLPKTLNKTWLQLLLTNLLFSVIHLQHLITTNRICHQLLLTNLLF